MSQILGTILIKITAIAFEVCQLIAITFLIDLMKQLLQVLIPTLAATISLSANAQEDINSSDLQQLKQLACIGNSSPQLQASLGELESTLTQILTVYNVELTDEQLKSAHNLATQVQAQLETEASVQEFCSDDN